MSSALPNYTANFLSGVFITAIVVNAPERKLAKRTSVNWFKYCARVVWAGHHAQSTQYLARSVRMRNTQWHPMLAPEATCYKIV